MQVVAVRQQAQAPVVARDFANMSEVDAKIVEIREAFQSIETHVPIARNAFFWRMFSYFASGPEAADVLLLNIQNVFNALPGLYEGVCKHAPRNELAGKMALVNDFELKAIRWEKDIHVLTSMRNASFIRMFVICQQHATALKNLLEIPDVEEQLKQLQVIVKACETTVLEHQLKEEAIELFNMVQVAASALKEKIDDRVEMTEGHKETINQFLITNKKRIEELPLKSCFERDLGNPEAISDETRAAIDGIKGSEQEFEVWKEYSLLSIAYSSVRGSCQQTKAHGNLMQEDIGKRIVGLLSDIKERLTLLSEHELTDIQAITVRRELNEYHQYILTIQQKLEEKGNQVWKLPQDERHETLRNYVHGLNLSLVRAMDILLLCRDFLKKQALNVTRIYVLMQRYLTRAVSPIADVASFEDTAAVFSVGLQIRAVKQIAMVELCNDKEIDSYVTRTQQIVESLFVRTATESCALREEEKLVFDVVMQGESLDGLYYKKESKTLLPKRVQAVLIKRATAALLLAKDAPLVSADGPVDSELELLFHILHTTPLYAETLKSVPDFAAVMEEYTSWHQTYRRDDFLHRAYGVLCSINQALTEKPDVFVFAKLIQAYVDF
ncbi:MAG: hypothetical protein LLF94_06510, partial [Chlamydiales bacterium]|nr:hypothetical protein [Chlamydiales bacterium]